MSYIRSKTRYFNDMHINDYAKENILSESISSGEG